MAPPLLKLSFVQGPIEGESREYKPGSTIRVGRVVRGNEITIKDGGISTKHLKIVSDSEHWIIQDLGSSNGTTVNLEDLDPDTPLNLSHGDVIRLGGDTIIEVYFVFDDKPPETNNKLPPRPRRNNRRLPVADPDPDRVEPVQEVPKRTRAGARSKTVEDVGDEEEKEPKVVARVGRPRKVAVTKEEEAPVEKKVSTRGRRVRKNTESDENGIESVQEVPKSTTESEVVARATRSRKNEKKEVIEKVEEAPVEKVGNCRAGRGKNSENLGLKSVKLEIENTPMAVEISPVKRATRSKKIGNACLGLQNVKSEDIDLEERDEQRVSRATRSKRKEIGGDSFRELDMVLNQARKSRVKKKKMEEKPPESEEMEGGNDEDVDEDRENEKDYEDRIGCSGKSDEEDEMSKNVEQEETELEKKEDGEAKRLKDMSLAEEECCDVERDSISETSEKVEQRPSERVELEVGNDDAEEEMVDEKDNDGCIERIGDKCDKEDEVSNRVEQVEIEFKKSSTLEEDGETEKLEGTGLLEKECQESERDCNSEGKQSKSVEMEARHDGDVEEYKKDEDQRVCSDEKCDTEDEISKRVETELKKSSLGEDGETEYLQEIASLEEECHDSKSEEKLSLEMEARNGDVEEDQKDCSNDKFDKEDEKSERVEQVEIELTKSSLGEHGETEKLQDTGLIEDECRGVERDCKSEKKLSESVEMEARNDDDAEEDEENEDQKGSNEKSDEKGGKVDEISERVEQVEIDLKKSSLGKDGETEKLQDTGLLEEEFRDSERDSKTEEAGRETLEKVEQEHSHKNVGNVKVDLKKLTLGEWFYHLDVYFRKQITKETEEMIEPMRSKALRVKQHIAEQKQAMGEKLVS